ncbi:hypothetical protein L198_02554 [Cryptococcus wingfieldii CBS 7118]|uniref:UDP-glycosyltransferases domain-containing protein n=1 Tax=Cryptococcus wingfieldii CBS 7118 TaxID=1295528 RepID=A0A1E3JNX1_9TREE|nr:hypothetical protein L198_02554 [Cryptococcus wingfieldii CBS 7118]ODO01827.1 hypothetical protein L198_02554 [Cryptococcus wingfieldii CBS 7118]
MCESFSLFHPEPASSYISTADSISALLNTLNPTLVVVDHMFDAARDAVLKGRWRSVRLSPNTVKDVAIDCQGWGIFKWPCFASGYPFPLPWYLFLPNTIGLILPIICLNFSRTFASFNIARNKAGYPGVIPLYSSGGPFPTKVLCMSTPEADLPAIIPEKIICCGPILQAVSPLPDQDPELDLWLAQRPTILISLGSHLKLSHSYATNLLRAISHLLSARSDVQVLWKLVPDGSYDYEAFSEEEGELGREKEKWGERLKVLRWLKAEPFAIMNTGRVICFVNHGGSNSYHEALATGVPQILLPAWLDCYDFASRVGYLRNGVWGNKNSAPSCSTPELIRAFDEIIGLSPPTSSSSPPLLYRQRALELQAIVTRNGTRRGRDVAAEVVWEEMEEGMMWGNKYEEDEGGMDEGGDSVMVDGEDEKIMV